MSKITVEIKGQFISKSGKNAGGAGSSNTTEMIMNFDKEWRGYAKRVIWLDPKGENETRVLLVPEPANENVYKTYVPAEVMQQEGWCSFTVEGYYEKEPQAVQKSVTDLLYVSYSAGTAQGNMTPDEAMQLHCEFEELMPKVRSLMENTTDKVAELCEKINAWTKYDGSTFYSIGNKVSFNGKCYVCIKDSYAVAPTDEEFWLMIADRGEKGAIGKQGPQGIRGEKGDKGERGDKGDKGDKGEKGEQGVNGVSVAADGFYAFDVDSEGDLWVHYPDESTPPDIVLNQNGELIIRIGQIRYNAGRVKGDKGDTPQKGVDYFTPADIEAMNIPLVDDDLSMESENPVQNKVIANMLSTLSAESSNLHSDVRGIRQEIAALETDTESLRLITDQIWTTHYLLEDRVRTLETQAGDIDTALDNIIEIQNSLIGGASE